jgi:phosphoribosylaminoimidazolecarboxamide formyltransferase / IMP cyclohydrolase
MFKNALVSVSDKTGLVDFLKPLVKQGLRVVSTGGTAKHLRDNGIEAVDVSEQTGFPEVMGGRVKTLHPKIHMAILSRVGVSADEEMLREYRLDPFDLVICNLYPFEQTLLQGASDDELIENIDIGGPTILRAAAKNHQRLAVVCDPQDYAWLQAKKEITLEERRKLAAKVFSHVASYDSLVAKELGAGWGGELSFGGKKVIDLRYGENPQQYAAWYRSLADGKGLHSAEVLQGKPLSFNNILDLDAASSLVRELINPAAVAVKHNNPCGVAMQSTLGLAVESALKADPVSVFGGIVAVNQRMEKKEAEALSAVFLECIVAPDFSDEALEVFAKKKNLRILRWREMLRATKRHDLRSVSGGFLIQEADVYGSSESEWQFIGAQPSAEILVDLKFAERVCASLKSNAIAIVKNGQTLGLGMGQVNRVEAVEHAISRMRAHHKDMRETILASDAFFPFADSIERAAQAGVKWVLQPGGSVKDEEVFAAARRLNVNMVLTGKRHFRH